MINHVILYILSASVYTTERIISATLTNKDLQVLFVEETCRYISTISDK